MDNWQPAMGKLIFVFQISYFLLSISLKIYSIRFIWPDHWARSDGRPNLPAHPHPPVPLNLWVLGQHLLCCRTPGLQAPALDLCRW